MADAFGYSLALSGTTALIGAPGATVGGNSNYGAAYVFSDASGTWQQASKLTASDDLAYARFGNAVVLSGTTALIGAYAANNAQGAAYFESSGNLALDAPASVPQGQSLQSQAIVTNSAATASVPLSLVLPVPAATSLVSATSAGGTCTTGTASVDCALTPIAANGGTAKVNLTLKATGKAASTIASSASVSGTTPPLTASANTTITGTPAVSLAPGAVSFAAQAVGSASAVKTVTLTNTGTADLTGIAVSITGADAGDFSATSNCAATLSSTAGSNSCTISVGFKPAAGGARNASLSIASNAAGSPATVALSGSGDVPPVVSDQTLVATAGQAASG